MSIAGVIQMPRMFQRDAQRLIEARVIEHSEHDQDIEHIKQLRAIAERADQIAAERRAESLEATKRAAECKRDYEEAQQEFAEKLRSEGVIK